MSALSDESALRRTAEIYARGADQRSKEAWSQVLADDVEISGPGFVLTSLESNLTSIDYLQQAFVATRHLVHDQQVVVEGDLAHGETICTAEHRISHADGGDRLMVWAIRYQDRWRREAAGWKFTHRALIVDWEEIRPVHSIGEAQP